MSDYLPIFTLSLEHNYYSGSICRAIDIRITSSGRSLLRRRGLIFKQTKDNQWVLIATPESAGVDDESDVLSLEMILVEPNFMHFTVWDKYDFRKPYRLELPLKSKTKASAPDVITIIPLEKKIKGDVLTTVNIKLSNMMFDNAKAGNPLINTLVFNAPKVYWEYVFCPRNPDLSRNLKIEESADKVKFGEVEKIVLPV